MLMRRGIGRVGRPGLIGTMARTAVVAGTATAVAGGVRGHQQQKALQAEQAAAHQQEQAQAAAADPGAGAAADPGASPEMGELQQLAQLHSEGVLTDDEFAAAKSKILGI